MATSDILVVVEGESRALIREELRTLDQRTRLERAIRDSIRKAGLSVDEVSAVSGLPPDEVREIADQPVDLEDMDVLAGVA